MRILMLSPYLPWPLHGGGGVRIFHVLKELSRQGHRIVLLAGQQGPPLAPDNVLHSLCEDVQVYDLPSSSRLSFALRSLFSPHPYPALRFQADSLQRKLHRLLRDQSFDLIWINFMVLADMVPQALAGNTPVVLDQHECEELVYRDYIRQGTWTQRIFAGINMIKVRNCEQRTLPRVGAILCVSEGEAAFMRPRVPGGVEVWTVPNGVDTEFFLPRSRRPKEDNIILLTGNMGVRRNIDAAVWFAERMFPAIRDVIPDAEFWIVGARPTREIWRLRNIQGVRVTGTVDDIRDYYTRAKVFVAPYRFGAGTKLKVLEAMACDLPTVATEIGCRGIGAVSGKHLLMAKEEQAFVNAVIELLTNKKSARAMGKAGRALVVQKYRWKEIVGSLEPLLHRLVGNRQTATAPHFPLRPGAAARRQDNSQEVRDSEGDFVRQALRQLSRDGRSRESLVAGSADGISYAVVPSRKRPRYLIPLGNTRWTLSGLSIITPYVRRWRILKRLLVCLANVGWNGWARERVLVHSDQLLDLRKLVKEVTGEAQPIFALALGRPGRFRKLTVQVMCPDGSVLGYIKFPFTEAGTERVRHEAAVLSELWTFPALRPHIPKVLHAGKWNDRFSLFLSPASGSPGPATFTPSHARFLQNLWSIYRVEKPGRVLVQKVSARWEKVAPSLNGQQRWLGNQALRWAGKWLEGTAVTCGVMHGDFAPGNICVKNNGELFVFDWELASWGEPIYWDVLNFRAVTSVIRGERKFPMNWAPSSPRGSQTRQAVRLLYLVDSLCSLLKEGREGRERAIEYRFKWLERFASDGGQINNSKNARSENYQLSHMR